MKKYGVLIVDDSAFMRRAVSMLIEKDPQFYIVSIARNGLEALEKLRRFDPDVITMDVEMPEMDGIEALARIMQQQPTPVVMLSNQTGEGTLAAIRALELGAVDFFLKDHLLTETLEARTLTDFHTRLKTAATAKVRADGDISNMNMDGAGRAPEFENNRHTPAYDLLVIGCSTGGPSALQMILPRIPSDYPASVIVVQHMPPGFTGALAERFHNICQIPVKEAENGEQLLPGRIYIAPSGFQTTARKLSDDRVVLQVSEKPITLYKPSVDITLESLAPIYRNRMLAAVLTGMGSDGLEGCRAVKDNGGIVLTEAEESCVVYGMPKVVYEAGLSDARIALPRMFSRIMSFL